ncbi:MAG: CHAD domain-containing protein [Pseudomarimonas sp.]
MTAQPTAPGERLRDLAETELRELIRKLALARRGKDVGVHGCRKALQRMRALVRLTAPGNVEWARREDGLLKRFRRRLGRLRDAAVRLELVEKLGKRELNDADRSQLDSALAQIRAARLAMWANYPPEAPFWDALEKAAARLQSRLAKWPLAEISEKRIGQAIERARSRVREALKEALGRVERTHRHDLRRRLRRLAALRQATAHVIRRRDAGAVVLLDLAREMGSEGDLWMAAAALRKCGHAHETRSLRRLLDKERRAACKRHDGELAAARRRLLAKPAKASESAARSKRATNVAAAESQGTSEG